MKMLRRIVFFVMSCMLAVMSAQQITAGALGDCSAKAAVVYDPVSGEFLYEKNADTRLPMASTTKIMSALIALESGNLDEQFTVDPEAIKTEGSSMGLREGDKVTMRAGWSAVCFCLAVTTPQTPPPCVVWAVSRSSWTR